MQLKLFSYYQLLFVACGDVCIKACIGGYGFGFIADKSVSFEKSVSFSDEPPDMNSPKQHSPQHGGK